MLAARGAYVIDTDEVAREVLARGSAGESAVLERFGPTVRAPDGGLDRRALARRVFREPADRLALEAITHPLIRQVVEARLGALEAGGGAVAGGDARAGTGKIGETGALHARGVAGGGGDTSAPQPLIAVLEIPLLDQPRRRQYQLDVVVLVEAPTDIALRRAAERGFSEQEARARLAAQPSQGERRAAADRVLSNSRDLSRLEESVGQLWDWITQTAWAHLHEGKAHPTIPASTAPEVKADE
jgi:dephospho-CoA kinase